MRWNLAKPRPDGSDTDELLRLAREKFNYVRRHEGGPTWMGMELISAPPGANGMPGPAPLDDPRLAAVENKLREWDEATTALKLLDYFIPCQFHPYGSGDSGGRGSSSGNNGFAGGRLGVQVTIDDPTGSAEGIVHEMAHLRLMLMGIELETHDHVLLENDDEWKWYSPVRVDVLRPMTALIHAIYAWTWMLELDLRATVPNYLQSNVPKVRRGLVEVRKGVKPTPSGYEFLAEWLPWADHLVSLGEQRLQQCGVEEITLRPPAAGYSMG